MNWINDTAIRTNQECASWQEAVRIAGSLLVDEGFVEPEYIEAMIKTAEDLGAYIVIAPGIAMPHARPDSGVKKSGFAAITLKIPVEFGNPDNDPVHFVIAFCAEDHDAHIEALKKLGLFLMGEDILNQILAAATPTELAFLLNGDDKSV